MIRFEEGEVTALMFRVRATDLDHILCARRQLMLQDRTQLLFFLTYLEINLLEALKFIRGFILPKHWRNREDPEEIAFFPSSVV